MFHKALYAVSKVALWIGGLSILAISLLGGADILSTLLLNKPIDAVYEGTQTLMVVAVFLGLGIVHLHRSYIAVDLGYELMPPRAKHLADIVALLLMLIFFGALAWRGWETAFKSWQIKEYTSGIIQFPIYPARFALAIGATLAVVACLGDLLTGGRFRKPMSLEERETGELSAS